MTMTSLYCTLADVRSELNSDSTVDDKKVMRGVRQLSRRIDRLFRTSYALFAPNILTQQIPLIGTNVNSAARTLLISGYLLSVAGVTIGTQSLTPGTNVQSYPTLTTPINALQLIGTARTSWYDYCSLNTFGTQFAQITGVWGYNVDYSNAWLAVDSLAAGINASVTTLTVLDVDADNPYGESPRLSAGNIIQIDSEWMDVIATDITLNTVKVIRGVNGSIATSHSMSAAVSVYLVDESIRRICRQAAFQYARIGAFDTTRITDFSTIQFPSDLLQEISDLLNMWANG